MGHSFSWKLIKYHMVAIIQDVIFPIMYFTDSDQELWDVDPHEYIRSKFGKYKLNLQLFVIDFFPPL